MPASPARSAAFEILLRVDRDDSYASELLHSSKSDKLSTADHGLMTELVMGVLRWRSLLDSRLAVVSGQKLERLDTEVLNALRLGIYQLMFLSRVPARAAIFESVELVKTARKRSAAPFVNAVLRKASTLPKHDLAESIKETSDSISLARSSAHPEWLVERWIKTYGLAAARAICLDDQAAPKTTIYVPNLQVAEELAREGVGLSPGSLLSSAHRVFSGDVAKINVFRDGRLHIQDEASQLVAMLAGTGTNILDCCAAPGGKTAVIAQRNPQARLIAADLHVHRVRAMRDRFARVKTRLLAADARHLPFRPAFDLILADVPCSGTGTLARNPEIKWRLRPDDLLDLQSRQIAIVTSAFAHLAPGGRLLYSTCSLEREENQDVMDAALNALPEASLIPCANELHRLKRCGDLAWDDFDALLDGPYLRTIPGVHPCDGFFAAILERRK
jgi:16S rRNA (cytosine967-C5)-methyltransferase